MKIIEKKILPQYFESILCGEKNYELRLNDFECTKGDLLILKEIDAETKEYTGRILKKEVGYVAKFKLDKLFWSKEEIEKHGIQIIALKEFKCNNINLSECEQKQDIKKQEEEE
ncbi:DUF3850 domain-containing protein [archaeon]|jgi:hypothetical protein|nr:DUF3850 domain-containing protein [archaeon]MBT6868950.1 DUF3850 domain-containing protein [archaeon]MBT7192829.1 DUF3850 domain-containing protein [archaeon]MBT7380795.1 DUF3850 domain-containing protein [archaeon]MBT7507550.1 DUF3850 domain-containing protein [archaeon]